MIKFLLLPALLIITSCTASGSTYQDYLKNKHLNPQQTSASFEHCRGYGCKFKDRVSLDEHEWKEIDALFKVKNKNAEIERTAIAQAIALLENNVGQKTGTNKDILGTFKKMGSYQHDCIDESTNTSIYIDLMIKRKLITLHVLKPPTMRLPILNSGRWPHQGALIKEIQSQELYIVDSWFHDNGNNAEIIPLNQWKDGWKPKPKDDS